MLHFEAGTNAKLQKHGERGNVITMHKRLRLQLLDISNGMQMFQRVEGQRSICSALLQHCCHSSAARCCSGALLQPRCDSRALLQLKRRVATAAR